MKDFTPEQIEGLFKADGSANVKVGKGKVICPNTGLKFYISDYIWKEQEYTIDVGLWPDGTRYETSIGLWPSMVKFYYRIKVKCK